MRGILSVCVLSPASTALAQAPQASVRSSVLPTGGGAALLDPSDTVFLLLDHQAGLFQTVKDITVAELRSNTVTLAKLATLMKIPVITTASEPNGTNGPLMPEIHEFAPHAVYVARKGEVNAWDNEDFVKIVEATGRKTLIMAGVWTSVCVVFPALDAKLAGLQGLRCDGCFGRRQRNGEPDDTGTPCPGRRHTCDDQRGAVGSAPHLECPEAAEIGKLYGHVSPNYSAVVESYVKAQEVARKQK